MQKAVVYAIDSANFMGAPSGQLSSAEDEPQPGVFKVTFESIRF
jgi:hypothetical protein